MRTESTSIKKLDSAMILILIALFLLSIVFIYSSQQIGQYGAHNFAMKQGINYIVGFLLLFLVAKLDIDQIEQLAWPVYITLFLSIILLRFSPDSIAPQILGAKRWFTIPLLGSIQPSEYFKIALIILVARIIVKHHSIHINKTLKTDLWLVGKVVIVTILPSIFVYQQPDTGMVVLYFTAIGSMLYLSGLNKKLSAVLTIIPLIMVSILVFLYFYQPEVIYNQVIPLLKPHQQDRIIGWLDPDGNKDMSYQSTRSLLAVGSGELVGNGIMNGKVYIPEKHTDFIFATIAEEGGFLLASIVITLLFVLIYKIIITGHSSETQFGAYVCAGIAFSMTLQIFQNIGMIIGLMPIKGISLPFLSYGGSSLLSNMIIMGIVLSIRKTFGAFMFAKKNEYL